MAFLLTAVLAFAACGEPAAGPTTTEPGATVNPPTTLPDDGTTLPTDPPAAPGGGAGVLAGTRWTVFSFGLDGDAAPVLPTAVPTIDFDAAGTGVGGTTGCNSWFGTVALRADGTLTITQIGMTEMACLDEGVMDQEQRFVEALGRIDSFADSDEGPTLLAADGSAIMVLRAPEAAPDLPITGAWRLVTFIDGEVASSVLAGTEVTLTIDLEAGTLSGNGGCNGFGGDFTATAGPDDRTASVEIGPIASTMMACEPDVMDQEAAFHATLGAASTFRVEEGFLTISTADGRALVFEPIEG